VFRCSGVSVAVLRSGISLEKFFERRIGQGWELAVFFVLVSDVVARLLPVHDVPANAVHDDRRDAAVDAGVARQHGEVVFSQCLVQQRTGLFKRSLERCIVHCQRVAGNDKGPVFAVVRFQKLDCLFACNCDVGHVRTTDHLTATFAAQEQFGVDAGQVDGIDRRGTGTLKDGHQIYSGCFFFYTLLFYKYVENVEKSVENSLHRSHVCFLCRFFPTCLCLFFFLFQWRLLKFCEEVWCSCCCSVCNWSCRDASSRHLFRFCCMFWNDRNLSGFCWSAMGVKHATESNRFRRSMSATLPWKEFLQFVKGRCSTLQCLQLNSSQSRCMCVRLRQTTHWMPCKDFLALLMIGRNLGTGCMSGVVLSCCSAGRIAASRRGFSSSGHWSPKSSVVEAPSSNRSRCIVDLVGFVTVR
jgi:hypothetical protein